jgi:hypothetical protein
MKNSKLNIVFLILLLVILVLIIMLCVKDNEHFRWSRNRYLQGKNFTGAIVPFYVDLSNTNEIHRLRSLGWYLCDGTKGTPDLRNRFIRGGDENTTMDETGGSETVQLEVHNLPNHTHSLPQDMYGYGDMQSLKQSSGRDESHGYYTTGDCKKCLGTPISIMPKYYVLAYFMFKT